MASDFEEELRKANPKVKHRCGNFRGANGCVGQATKKS
jgi:hypothetical protein